jgi:hypothetical protein
MVTGSLDLDPAAVPQAKDHAAHLRRNAAAAEVLLTAPVTAWPNWGLVLGLEERALWPLKMAAAGIRMITPIEDHAVALAVTQMSTTTTIDPAAMTANGIATTTMMIVLIAAAVAAIGPDGAMGDLITRPSPTWVTQMTM